MPYRLVAHKIQKSQHAKKAVLIPRKALISATPEAEALVDELRSAINRHNPQGAKFLQPSGEQAPTQTRILRYLKSVSDSAFLAYSMDASRKLMAEMEEETATSGGYLVFAEYERGEQTYILIVLLSTRARSRFDPEMNLLAVETLDVDHVRHAARIRYSGISTNEAGTVHFVAKSSDGLFFRKFIDCDPITDSTVQANKLRTQLGFWSDQENHDDEKRDEVLRNTYTYWKSCRRDGTNMTLGGLANFLYPDAPGRFLGFLSNEETGLAGDFSPPDAKSMRQFQKFSFSGNGLKLEFDRQTWAGKITTKNNTVTIKNVPHDLIEQLSQES